MTSKPRNRSSKQRLRHVAVLPSLLTLLNAICGFAAIHFAARGMSSPDAFALWLEKPELTFFWHSFQGITKNINSALPDTKDIDILRHCFTAPSARPDKAL